MTLSVELLGALFGKGEYKQPLPPLPSGAILLIKRSWWGWRTELKLIIDKD